MQAGGIGAQYRTNACGVVDVQFAVPAIEAVIDAESVDRGVRETGAGLVRMSGSGATCFALYDSDAAARTAAMALAERHPRWFFTATRTIGATDGPH